MMITWTVIIISIIFPWWCLQCCEILSGGECVAKHVIQTQKDVSELAQFQSKKKTESSFRYSETEADWAHKNKSFHVQKAFWLIFFSTLLEFPFPPKGESKKQTNKKKKQKLQSKHNCQIFLPGHFWPGLQWGKKAFSLSMFNPFWPKIVCAHEQGWSFLGPVFLCLWIHHQSQTNMDSHCWPLTVSPTIADWEPATCLPKGSSNAALSRIPCCGMDFLCRVLYMYMFIIYQILIFVKSVFAVLISMFSPIWYETLLQFWCCHVSSISKPIVRCARWIANRSGSRMVPILQGARHKHMKFGPFSWRGELKRKKMLRSSSA